jgi:diguanylate cyclase (GGDEF)-like protein
VAVADVYDALRRDRADRPGLDHASAVTAMVGGSGQFDPAVLAACRWLKADSYTGIVPAVVLIGESSVALRAAFEAGADEVIRASELVTADRGAEADGLVRLAAMLRRSDRDTSVHPSTRLPGTFGIEDEIARRLALGGRFAVCYADLDHFKEFNDRYGYTEGDRIIRMLATILHDVVKGSCGDEGFVGHIGGDDFIFVVPLAAAPEVCQEVIDVFDGLIPLQYSMQDRRTGYFFGKDRRGRLHRVPLMTLSIGVATNARRHFEHAVDMSELATEMKTYAKTLSGSVYAVDRRTSAAAAGSSEAATDDIVRAADDASATPVSSVAVDAGGER